MTHTLYSNHLVVTAHNPLLVQLFRFCEHNDIVWTSRILSQAGLPIAWLAALFGGNGEHRGILWGGQNSLAGRIPIHKIELCQHDLGLETLWRVAYVKVDVGRNEIVVGVTHQERSSAIRVPVGVELP